MARIKSVDSETTSQDGDIMMADETAKTPDRASVQTSNDVDSKLCIVCQTKPVYINPQTKLPSPYCSQTCATAVNKSSGPPSTQRKSATLEKRPSSPPSTSTGNTRLPSQHSTLGGLKLRFRPNKKAKEDPDSAPEPPKQAVAEKKEPSAPVPVEMCEVCHRKPKFKDESKGIIHPYCGKTCAEVHKAQFQPPPPPSPAQPPPNDSMTSPSTAPAAPRITIVPASKPDLDNTSNDAKKLAAPVQTIRIPSRSDPPKTPQAHTPNAILFYHSDGPYYGFTNFSPHPIEYLNKVYPTSEHLFQALKFMKHRPEIAEKIRRCGKPREAFEEAHNFQADVRQDWFEVNVKKMDMVLSLKFQQHPELRKELLDTGNALLVEDSDRDSFWDIGVDRQGKNELGKCLMRLRDDIRKSLAEQG